MEKQVPYLAGTAEAQGSESTLLMFSLHMALNFLALKRNEF